MGLYYLVSSRIPGSDIDVKSFSFDSRASHGITEILRDDSCFEIREWSNSSRSRQFGEAFSEPDFIARKIKALFANRIDTHHPIALARQNLGVESFSRTIR